MQGPTHNEFVLAVGWLLISLQQDAIILHSTSSEQIAIKIT